jgi:hypothetical protein
VRVRSCVVETPVSKLVDLRDEHVEIDRRPVDRDFGSVGDPFRERTIAVEERAGEPVVSKEVRVKEELVLEKDVEQRASTVSYAVRSTEVEDECGGPVTGTGTSDRAP